MKESHGHVHKFDTTGGVCSICGFIKGISYPIPRINKTPQSELDKYWFEFLHYWKERNSLPTQDAYWKWYIINKLEES